MSYITLMQEIKNKCGCNNGCSDCDKKISYVLKLKKANVPIKYLKNKITDIENDEIRNKINNYIKNIQKAYSNGIGLYLYGPNGTGKTSIEIIIAKEAVKQGYSVMYCQFSYVIDTFYKNEDQSQFLDCDFLILDDIDKAYIAHNSIFPLSKLDYILRYRCQKSLVTIASSNLSIQQYLYKIKDSSNEIFIKSLESLFDEVFIPLHINGEDYRKKIREKNKKLFLLENDNI